LSPGRRTNRENFRSCQRTSLFLLLSFLESIKNRILYLLKNQLSAGRPQPSATDLVQSRKISPMGFCDETLFFEARYYSHGT
jgi:hypothetical protein